MTRQKTLLVLCGSLGMGNSARLLGIVQALRRDFRVQREELRIVVCAGGKAARFWQANAASVQAEVVTLEEYSFSPGQAGAQRIRWSGFLRLRSAAVYLRNSLRLRALLKRGPADLALIDSDYHCLPLLFAGIPIIALGQAGDVLRRQSAGGGRAGLPALGMFIERLDFLFQRLVSRLVLVPSFSPAPGAGKVRFIPLIVREEFTAPEGPAPETGTLYALTGGSGIGSAALLDYAGRHGLTVIGSLPEPSPVLDGEGRPLIDRAAAVIVQGGLSSISECLARGRKMVVLPIEGHGEQFSNAAEVERLGLGLRVSELSSPPDVLLKDLEKLRPAEPRPGVDGAGTAAGILLETLGLRPPRP
jgi:hypothetical protein